MEAIDLTVDDEPIDLLGSDGESTKPVQHQPSRKTALNSEDVPQHKNKSALHNLCHNASSARRRTAQLSKSSAADTQPVALPAQQEEPARGRLLETGQRLGEGSDAPPRQSNIGMKAIPQQSAASSALGQLPDPWTTLPPLTSTSALPSTSSDARISLSLSAASAVAKQQQQQSAPLQAGSTEPTPVKLKASPQQQAPPTDGALSAVTSSPKRPYHPPRHFPTLHTQRQAPKPATAAGQVVQQRVHDLQQATQRNSASAMEQMAKQVIESQQAAQTPASHTVPPGSTRSVSHLQRPGPRQQVALPKSHQDAGGADTAPAKATSSAGNVLLQLTTAGDPPSSAAPQQPQGRAATAAHEPSPSIRLTAPFSLSASMQHHFGAAQQQAAAAQPPAESRQTGPAQHSLLHTGASTEHLQVLAATQMLKDMLAEAPAQHSLPHRGASSDHRQAPAAPQTFLRGLRADPALAAGTEQTASNAAVQTKPAAATTQGVPAQPPLPQQWAASKYTPSQMSAQTAYAAFFLHMNMCGAPPLKTAIGLVFHPDALQHQLDQQFMGHAYSMCHLIPKAANPGAASPYSQSSKAPNTWRAAVLGLIDWLVEVHHQGIVEGDPGAKQHRALLLCTIGKAGNMQKDSVVTIRGFLMSIGEHLSVQLSFWCRWISENLPKKSETQMAPAAPVPNVASGAHPVSEGPPVSGSRLASGVHQAQAGSKAAAVPARSSASGLSLPLPFRSPLQQPVLTAASVAHPVSGGHPLLRGHPASGGPPASEDHQSQAGPKPGTVPAPFSVPEPCQLSQFSRSPLGQPAAPAAATYPETSPDAKASTPTVAARTLSKLWTNAWESNVGSKQLATVVSRTVGNSLASADSVPEAAVMSCDKVGMVINTNMPEAGGGSTDLSPTGPSASRLAQRAAESQRPTMHPQSAPTTTAPAAPDSLAVRNGLPVNAQQQGSQSLPSSPLPQQPSLGAAASPRSGLLAKGKLSGGVLAAKGCIAGQPAPVEGNADGQASGSAAAPVPGKGTEHVVPARVNAGEQTSGRASAAAAAASAAAAATDQTRALGSANVSARVLTEAPSSALPAEDAKAVGQDKSMDHGATSPTVLTQAVPNAQRRQLWQSDWIRQQTCMAHLKAAKHDTLMWLRPPQKASARRANRQRVNLKLQEEKACSKEALACRVDLHKQKFPAAGVADDPVLAGFEQAILLTDCFEQLMDGSCPGVVLDHFECRAKALREDGADPLAQQAHYEDDALLIKQFYDSLKEAAQLAARPATRQCLSPSVSGEAILPAAAGVKAEASAAAANNAEPKALPQTTQPAGLEVCAGLPLHPSLAPTSATAAAAVAAAAQPTAEQDTDEGAMPVSVEKPSGKQAKAETATQLGQAAAAADKHEEPVGSKPSHADPQQQGQQAATDSKAEARKVKAECSERMRAKKVAAQRAKRAKTAEAVKADSADNGQAKQRAEAGKARAQKARSASVEGNQADKPAARPAELEEVQKPDSVPAESSQPQKPTAGLAQAETMAQERGSAALAETTAKQPAAGHTETATKAQKTDCVHAERNRARRPTAEDIKAGTDAQEPALAQVKNTQAKKPATTEAANKAEAETMDPASAQTSQGHQAVAQAERPEAVGSDASANRDKLRPLSLFSEAAFKTSDANAAGHMLSKTAAVAASTGQQHPAGKATDMAPADPVPGPLSYLPLVSVENNGRSFCMVAESSGRNNQDVKALLAMDQGICVNPAYLATCLPQEREALEAGGLLNNNHAPRHQAALQKASKDKLVVSAAAAAHGKQDRTPVAATLSLGSTEAQVQDAVPASAGAEHKQPKPPAAAAAAATRAQAAAPKPAIVTVSTQSLAADVAQQVSEDKGPVDAPLTEGPSSPTAKSPSAAASLVPTSPTAPSALPAPNGPTAPEGPTAPAPAGPIAHPTALGNPPAHATKQSSKKRKQAKQPSKGAGGSAVSQRKRKKPLGSEVAAAGAGSGLAHQEEARTSVSTLDYTVGDPSLGDPGQDGEVASPKDADPDSVRAKLAVPAVKPEWPPLSPTSSSLAARESTAAQHVRSPPARDPPTAADDTHMQTADATHATTHGAHLPQQHGGSPPTKESPTTAEDTHVQAAGPTPGSHPPQQHVGSPPAQDPPTTADDTHMQAPDPTPRAHPPHQQSSLQADDRSRQSEPDATVERHGSQQRQETAKQRQQQQQPHELPQQQQQDEQELRQQQQQQKELPPQQQQQKQQQQQQQEQAGQSAQPAQSKGSDQAQEQLIAAEAECQQQKDAEEVACTAGNLDSMLLTKQAALAMFAFELQLEEWRASHNRQSYHSLLLGSYILVSGHDHIHLRQVKGFRADANRFPVFITTNEEEVPYDCLSDSQHCCDQQVLLEQKRILDQGKQARLTRLEVADANAAVRLRLCMEYFSVLKQLASKGLSEADRISLQQQLEHTILRTQSRPSQEVLDAVEGDFEGQEKASQVQLDELQQKLRLAADMKASDTPGNRDAQQAQSQGQEATAPSQPAAVIISRKGMNTTPAVAKSSNDTPPELPQAKATPSSPDPQKQADAVMGSRSKPKQTEDKAVSKYPEATDSEPTALLVLAAKDGAPACPLVATPSTAHTPTAPQVAAQSLRQPVTLPADVPAASQGNNETQPAQISGQNMPMSRLAEPQALLVSNQAAAQGASEPMPPLLGVSSVTPLPPPVYSPARAVPTALKPAESPMGPLPSTSVAAEPARTVPTALKPTESPVGLLPSTSVAAEPAGSAVEAGTAKDDHHDTAMADVGAPGEEEASGVEAAQGTAVALASQEATARMMMWQVYQPSQGLVDLISGGMVHSALLTHTAAWGSAPAVLNVTIESHGTWGFVEWASVECVKALAKSQAEGSCPWTHLGGIPYWLILSTPNVPVPAYACSAAAAASMSVLTADQKPKYNHATDSHQTDQPAVVQSGAVPVAGAVQSAALHPEGVATSYQYPSYGHGYGYAQGYGYTGWPAVPAWQPVHQWPFTLQAPLGHHQPVPPPQPPPLSAPPPSSPALPANQTSAPPQTTPEPIRQLVPLAPQPPQPEAPDPVQAPEITLQTITSFVSDTGLRSKPLGLSGKRPAPAADAASKGKFPVKKHASEVKGKPSGTKASGLMTALDKPSSKADLATQEHPQNPSKTSPGPPKKLFAFALNPQAQSRRRTAAAGPSSSSPSSTLHPATATTPPATAATPPATAATAKPLPQNAPVVEESASDHLTDLPSRSSRRRLSSAKGSGLRAVPSAAPSAKPVDGSLPSNAVTAALSSEMQGASTRVVVPMTRLYASPQVHPNPAPAMAPTIPQADQPCSLAASQSWAKSGSLPLKFRFDMAEPAVTSGSNLADAGGQNHGLGTTSGLNLAGAVHHDGRVGITSGSNLADAANLATGVNITSAEAPPTVHEGIPLLPDSATAEEEAAQQEKEELPPLPPSPGAVSGSPRLPDGSPALLGKSVKPTLRMVTASEQLPPLPLSPPQQKSRRSSSSSMGSRWGKPQPDPTTTTTDGTQKAVAETATAMSHHTAAVQLPEQLHEQLPVTPMDESSRSVHRPFTRWDAPAGLPGPPPLPHPPGGTLQSAPPSYGIPTDPRLARRGRPQSALRPTPTPEGSSMVAPSNPHNPSTTGLHRPSAHAPKLPREPPQHTPQHPPQQQSQQHPPQHPPQQHPPQQPPQITQAGSGSWYVANPDACDRCRSSSMALRYRWGRGSAVEDSLEVTACLWSTKRMGRCLAQRGYKAELFELLFPLHLKFEDLGRRHTLSSDRQRGDWYRDLRHRWDGSLVVFTAQHATQHATMIGLARLCSLLRESKQPLLSVEGALGPARLWLTSSLGILQTVMDYMSEGALASLKQVVPGVGSADASNTQKLSFVVGLVLLND